MQESGPAVLVSGLVGQRRQLSTDSHASRHSGGENWNTRHLHHAYSKDSISTNGFSETATLNSVPMTYGDHDEEALIPKDDGLDEAISRLAAPSYWSRFTLWFNSYRRLFTFVFTFNLLALILAASGAWDYPKRLIGGWVLGNLATALLIRNDLFVRFIHAFVNAFFAKWPSLGFRMALTSTLLNLDGVQAGCWVSTVFWLIFRIALDIQNRKDTPSRFIILSFITIFNIIFSLLSALYQSRQKFHHITLERFTRFFGWIGIASTWIYVILADMEDVQDGVPAANSTDFFVHLIQQQQIWLTIIMTTCIILAWVSVKKVPFDLIIASESIAVLRFQSGMGQGLTSRIGRRALWEYQSFGIISEGKFAEYHYLICAAQSEFLQDLVKNPVVKIWSRVVHLPVVAYTSKLYRRGIYVCSGLGIGAAMSTCMQNRNWLCIWVATKQQRLDFGPTLTALIHRCIEPNRMIMWDPDVQDGRGPMKYIKKNYQTWGAEVVYVTGPNHADIVQGCAKAGIPAYGST